MHHLERLDPVHWHGMLEGEGETVEFDLWRSIDRDEHRPLVLLVPILAGGRALMELVADGMFSRGFDVAFCARAGSAMQPEQDGGDLQRLFDRTVLHQRLFLAWHRGATAFEQEPQFVLGISLGGIIATAVAAEEPDLAGVAICLSGADLPDLVLASSEKRVRRWVASHKAADGVGADHLRWDLHRHLRSDPLRMAQAIPTRKVLFVCAEFDTVVPRRNRELLWEALGRPVRMTVPLGHYSAALALWPILDAAAAHFDALRRRMPLTER